MTIPINMTLYRLLVKSGASEADAEAAATVDVSTLATRADITELKALMADTNRALLMWIIVMLIGQTGLLLTIMRAMRP